MLKLTQDDVKQIAILARNRGKSPDLSQVDLRRLNLRHTDLRGGNFKGSNLIGTDLSEANLSWANLSGATLKGANLTGANLDEADLSHANLTWANLNRTHLNRADIFNTDFHEAILAYTIFANVDLSQAKGLETIEHYGPSSIDIHTLIRSQGKIPEVFLQGAGIANQIISYMVSLTNKPIQYYSCFISYSHRDQAFAERLYIDLQSQGVRCWYAPEDLRIGDKMKPTIDRSIQLHDKVLIILSKNSINSDWVEREVETAFEEEHQRNETVLFPVRLDEAVLETRQSWAADIRRTRYIGEFSGWKDHDTYQLAFKRLLRDLKSSRTPAQPSRLLQPATHTQSYQRQLLQHYNNLNKLKEQAAIYALGETPLYLLNKIEAEQTKIAELEAQPA